MATTLSHPTLKRRYHAAAEGFEWLLEIAAAGRKGHRVQWSTNFIEAVRREVGIKTAEMNDLARQLDAIEETV